MTIASGCYTDVRVLRNRIRRDSFISHKNVSSVECLKKVLEGKETLTRSVLRNRTKQFSRDGFST